MKKINNWENVQEPTKFHRLAPGGYICAIKDVKDIPEKEYLEIYFDIVKGDEKGYFQKQYDNDTRENKRWPNTGTLRRSYKEGSESFFKQFITSIEKSNPKFTWNWDESKLKNKYFGAVIGEEEYLTQRGKKGVRNNVVFVHSTEAIENGDFEVPELKVLENTKSSSISKPIFKNPFEDDIESDNDTFSPFSSEDEDDPFGIDE